MGSSQQTLRWHIHPSLGPVTYLSQEDKLLQLSGEKISRPSHMSVATFAGSDLPTESSLIWRSHPKIGTFTKLPYEDGVLLISGDKPARADSTLSPALRQQDAHDRKPSGLQRQLAPRASAHKLATPAAHIKQGAVDKSRSEARHKVDSLTPIEEPGTAYDPMLGMLTTVPRETSEPGVLISRSAQAGRMRPKPGVTEEETETLLAAYKTRPDPHRYFAVGRVFATLWTEPLTGEAATNVSWTEVGGISGRHYSRIMRFVVIREGDTYCSALPITTYGGKGVAKASVNKSEHVIIYTSRVAPEPLPNELPQRGEAGMMSIPIRVNVDRAGDKLDPRARLHLAKVSTINHSAKVKSFGTVSSQSRDDLVSQFDAVWRSPPGALSQAPQGHSARAKVDETIRVPGKDQTSAESALLQSLMSIGYDREQAMGLAGLDVSAGMQDSLVQYLRELPSDDSHQSSKRSDPVRASKAPIVRADERETEIREILSGAGFGGDNRFGLAQHRSETEAKLRALQMRGLTLDQAMRAVAQSPI